MDLVPGLASAVSQFIPRKIWHGVQGRDVLDGRRIYRHPLDYDDIYHSVTSVLGETVNKDYLRRWYAKLACEYMEKHRLMGNYMRSIGKFDQFMKEALRQGEVVRIQRAAIGSYQHDILEKLVLDDSLPEIPFEIASIEIDGKRVDHDMVSHGLLNFFIDFADCIEVLAAELTVLNTQFGYGGTVDLIIRIKLGGKWITVILDLKSGNDEGESEQFNAYGRCDTICLPLGEVADMPQIDGAMVLHLSRKYVRGYKLKEVPYEPAIFQNFIHRLCSYERLIKGEEKRKALYPPLPDGSQPLPMIEDIDHGDFFRCKSALKKAGVYTLHELASLTREELQIIRGIGNDDSPTYKNCVNVLDAYGFTLIDSQKEAS